MSWFVLTAGHAPQASISGVPFQVIHDRVAYCIQCRNCRQNKDRNPKSVQNATDSVGWLSERASYRWHIITLANASSASILVSIQHLKDLLSRFRPVFTPLLCSWCPHGELNPALRIENPLS